MRWDAFIFFNELDLLEIRLKELAPVVDRFVLCEATHTFSGQPKELHYANNRSRFRRWAGRIEHVVVSDLPGPEAHDRWQREAWQRNALSRGLHGLQPDDLLLISDVDEIPSRQVVKMAAELCTHPVVFMQRLFYYWLNCEVGDWAGTMACRGRDLTSPEGIRLLRGTVPGRVPDAGWHFSFLGDVALKIASFSHHEVDIPRYKDPETIADNRRRGLDPFGRSENAGTFKEIDESWPRAVVSRPERYAHLLRRD